MHVLDTTHYIMTKALPGFAQSVAGTMFYDNLAVTFLLRGYEFVELGGVLTVLGSVFLSLTSSF